MCGIVGKICFNETIDALEIKNLCDRLISRGPDDEGIFVNNQVGLGHRRLSVIDLEMGIQPMRSEDGNCVIVFNGEIYNFLELREELVKLGVNFSTQSDTEVILRSYQMYGINKTLNILEGMFAFVLYDISTKNVYVARDKFGEKPLYYIKSDDSFIFASELKALTDEIENKNIDKDALNLFFSLSYIPAPRTIYEQVKKLMPATCLQINLETGFTEFVYYDLLQEIQQKPKFDDFELAKKELESLLISATKRRMVSDVPLGAFLSGGIDSSIISSIMARESAIPIITFSIGFVEKEYDESSRAAIVAKNIRSEHYLKYLDYKDVLTDIDSILAYYDEPFGDSSAIASNYVAKLAREKVTVALTGDCADELFGGYEKYLVQFYITKFNALPEFLKILLKTIVNKLPHNRLTNGTLRRVKKVINNAELSSFDLHYEMMCIGVTDSERKNLLMDDFFSDIRPVIKERFLRYENGTDIEKGYYTDLTTVLEGDMLVKVDRICMKNSLEARVPFLDSKIVELAYRIPNNFKIKGNNKKYILKETFKKYLPSETIKYKKQGFGVPVDYWLKNQLKAEMISLMNQDFILKQGIFNYDTINNLFNEHLSGKENNKGKLWNFYVFQKWYNNNISCV